MPAWVTALLGHSTVGEVALVALLFVVILAFSWAPRLGERLGGLFDGREDRD